jgi:hypothetical protein
VPRSKTIISRSPYPSRPRNGRNHGYDHTIVPQGPPINRIRGNFTMIYRWTNTRLVHQSWDWRSYTMIPRDIRSDPLDDQQEHDNYFHTAHWFATVCFLTCMVTLSFRCNGIQIRECGCVMILFEKISQAVRKKVPLPSITCFKILGVKRFLGRMATKVHSYRDYCQQETSRN